MSKYVVVADGGVARVLRARPVEGPLSLEEIVTFVRPSARLPKRDLVSDKPGTVLSRAGRAGPGSPGMERHGADSEFDPHLAEIDRFARRLVRRLDEERRRGDMDSLHIVAEPRFLGLLRQRLSKPTRQLVETETVSDMIHANPREIARTVEAAGHQEPRGSSRPARVRL